MIFIVLTAIIFAVDQISKNFISKNVEEGQYIEVVEDKFYITNIKNKGAAYGILKDNRFALLFATIISVLAIIKHFLTNINHDENLFTKLGTALTLGGGLGNAYDRVVKKKVTDFMYIKAKNAPIFNFADLAILIGAIFVIIGDLRKRD